jgi:hypothetical protein
MGFSGKKSARGHERLNKLPVGNMMIRKGCWQQHFGIGIRQTLRGDAFYGNQDFRTWMCEMPSGGKTSHRYAR